MTAVALDRWTVSTPWRRPLLVLAALQALILLVYGHTAAAMVDIWYRSDTFAHAFVVPPITLWLVWRQRAVVARLPARPVAWMALPMLVLVLVWQLGDLVSVNSVTQLMLVALLVCAVPAVLGWRVTWALMFPLAFLFFSVPIGEFLTPWLMQYTADFTVAAVRASGVPVFREGLKFVIPSGSWSVVEACSGIRYLMASAMVGALFAYLNYRSTWRRVLFMAVAIAVPILANWFRAYMIVMLGHLSGNQLATGVDHLVYGWVFFGIVIMAMFFIGARWAEPDDSLNAEATAESTGGDTASSARWAASLLPLALVVCLPLGASVLMNRDGSSASGRAGAGQVRSAVDAAELRLPAALGSGWVSGNRQLPLLQPVFPGASSQAWRVYEGGDGPVGVYVAQFRREERLAKLVSSVNVLVAPDDPQWNQLSSQRVTRTAKTGPSSIRVTEILAPQPGAANSQLRMQAWQFYWIDGDTTANDIEAKLLQAWQRLRGRGEAGTAIVVYTQNGEGSAGPLRLERFIQEAFPSLDELIRGTDQRGGARP